MSGCSKSLEYSPAIYVIGMVKENASFSLECARQFAGFAVELYSGFVYIPGLVAGQ
jgi:hypothetical protein